jgi:hypothetical protein
MLLTKTKLFSTAEVIIKLGLRAVPHYPIRYRCLTLVFDSSNSKFLNSLFSLGMFTNTCECPNIIQIPLKGSPGGYLHILPMKLLNFFSLGGQGLKPSRSVCRVSSSAHTNTHIELIQILSDDQSSWACDGVGNILVRDNVKSG